MKISKKWKIIWVLAGAFAIASSATLGVSLAEGIRLQKTQAEVLEQSNKPVYSVHVVDDEVYIPVSGSPASVVLVDDAGYTYHGIGIGNINSGMVNIEITDRCAPDNELQCSPAELLAVNADDASILGIQAELKSVDQNGTLTTVLSVTPEIMIGLETKSAYAASNHSKG